MGKIGAFFRLTRIEHSLMLVIAVIAAELISKGLPALSILILSVIVPIFSSMGSFAINDYFDVESDRINKRLDRPIVSGEISRKSALYIAVVTFFIGIAASAFINLYAFVIALIFGILAIMYSYKLKDTLIIGNICIALSMAIVFIFGDFVVTNILQPSIIFIFFIIFLSGMAREIHGMIRDYRGDSQARQTKNLLFYTNRDNAARFAFIFYIEAISLSLFLFFFYLPFEYNLVYLAPTIVADALIAFVALMYFREKSVQFYNMSRNISLLAMGIALLAYLASPLLHIFI
jgi:geranylgeranylglycerol-phosphate geranylgeranyltransferase